MEVLDRTIYRSVGILLKLATVFGLHTNGFKTLMIRNVIHSM
jgi:hypothetical protein